MPSAADAAPSFLYLPGSFAVGESLALEGDEARYLSRVVRARPGDRVTSSDGEGTLATLEVIESRPEVHVRVLAVEHVPEPPALRLLCGAPEGERGDWLVEKLAELGVTHLVPVETERVRWPAPLRLDRWERLTVAALRQSRSAWRLQLCEPLGLREAVAAAGPGERWLADPAGTPAHARALLADTPVAGAVGPSSGFSEPERNWLSEQGFVAVSLSASRLRTETAALALASRWASSRA
ncbi:MAG: 16S rRNA (uracil(1498)-N(3))-methyltransferase [Candidatus Eisenbacteria bacterium]|nr:16S rRNA (uracil(1498)-N(3))-methyltransferase [Candidatus Eisenbacteria bacterium]